MQQLIIKDLDFKYKNSTIPIFNNLNLDIYKGWSCIVGSNGSGKSTLLKLISKELIYDSGTIKGNELVHYCVQSTEHSPKKLDDFMLTFNNKSFKIRDKLKIDDSWLYQWNNLSHGERKRLQLAVALYEEPDILLVDEPTNHLDILNKTIVSNALKSFKGIGILVSHDRELLDNLSQHTIILKNQNISTFNTSFSNAMDEYYKNIDFIKKSSEKQNIELKKLKNSIQQKQEKVNQSKKRLSKRNLNKNDSDTKNKINLAKLTGKDKNDGQVVAKLQSKQKQLLSSTVKSEKSYELGIKFNAKKAKNIFPIKIKGSLINLSDTKKLSFEDIIINEYDKIGIIGKNGSGKSTFIKNLLSSQNLKKQYLYIPQEITEEQSKDFFNEVNNLSNEVKGEIYTIIRKLSSDPIKLQDSFVPSPGEIRKLIIAKGLLENPSLIILDEPTNHMDLDSIIALESTLKEYNGTVIMISHDITFINNVTTNKLEFKKVDENTFSIYNKRS